MNAELQQSMNGDDMTAHTYGARRGAPRPPADIEAEMQAAGAAGDDVALGIAHARYTAWLADVHGIVEGAHGSSRPDGAIR